MIGNILITPDDFTVCNYKPLGSATIAGTVLIVETAGIDSGDPVIFGNHIRQLQPRLFDEFIGSA